MTVGLWWETTSIVIDTVLALLTLILALALTWLSVQPARNTNVFPAAAVTVALAVMMQLAPHTTNAAALQTELDRQKSIDGPYATQMWSSAASNMQTITECAMILRYIHIALAVLMVASALITAYATLRRLGSRPAAQAATGPRRRRNTETGAGPASRFTHTRPTLAVAATMLVAALTLAGVHTHQPATPAPQRLYARTATARPPGPVSSAALITPVAPTLRVPR